MSDRDALAQRIHALFLGELDDAVRVLDERLLQLEAAAGTEAGTALVRELFRVAHGLKGAAHAAADPEVAAIAHRLEDELAKVRDGVAPVDGLLVARMLADVDALARTRSPGAVPSAAPLAAPGVAATPAPAPAPPRTPEAAAPGPAVAAPAVEAAPAASSVRVSTAKLDVLLERTNELVAAIGQVAAALAGGDARAAAGPGRRSAPQLARRLTRLGTGVADAAVALTFQSFAEVAAGLDRVVHDLAAAHGKRVRLEVVGGDVEVDRAVGAALREPLLHLVRNAVGHGIEAPDARTAAGKPPVGRLTLTASLSAGRLQLDVADDGRGLDRAAVRRAAHEHGLPEGTEEELVFAAGLSTAAGVSDVSGRGVGLDAIRARLHAMGGTARLRSEEGVGTTVTLVSPVTLALSRVLTVRAAGELVCLPLTAVTRLVRCEPTATRTVDGVPTLVLDGAAVPVVALGAAAELVVDAVLPPGLLRLVLVDVGGGAVALAVDELVGEADVVVRGRPERLAGLEAVLGTASLPDGSAALVLNVAECVRHGLASARRGLAIGEAPAPPQRPQVLVVDDTVTTRTLEAGILEAAGYRVVAAGDGAEAWDVLQLHGADLVLSDVDMPRLDGIELCRMIRASERFGELPVVLLTSLADEADRRRGLDAGASAYIVKSEFDRDTLLDVIERAL